MIQLFARVELRGTPSAEIYQRLHNHMLTLNWYTHISGSGVTVALPHATYQAKMETPPADLRIYANELKSGIEANVWTKALVLVAITASWWVTEG
jgi:hypothetical protein